MLSFNNEQMSSNRIRVHIISSVATTVLTVKYKDCAEGEIIFTSRDSF